MTTRDEARAYARERIAEWTDIANAPRDVQALATLLDETEPTPDESEALADVIESARTPMGGQLLGSRPQFEAVADAILAAGFHRQGPIADDTVRAALGAWYSGAIFAGGWTANEEKRMRAALEAAEAAR